jgi:hypothetical protein
MAKTSTAPLAVTAMTRASVAAVGWLQAQPRDTSEIAVVFPPWMAPEAALLRVAAAGGLVVRQGLLGTILVVHGDDPKLGNVSIPKAPLP